MTEQEWLTSYSLSDFDLQRLYPKQYRNWRLFAVACCRRAMALDPDVRFEPLATCAEQFADALLTWADVKERRRVISLMLKERGGTYGRVGQSAQLQTLLALNRATDKTHIATLRAASDAQRAFAAGQENFGYSCYHEGAEQVRFVRDIFGNPFRPVAFAPAWRTVTAVAIARQMYESRDFISAPIFEPRGDGTTIRAMHSARDFSAMPILADALQDAGCDNADILTHCRDANQVHVRGCWVVDLVLGKA